MIEPALFTVEFFSDHITTDCAAENREMNEQICRNKMFEFLDQRMEIEHIGNINYEYARPDDLKVAGYINDFMKQWGHCNICKSSHETLTYVAAANLYQSSSVVLRLTYTTY